MSDPQPTEAAPPWWRDALDYLAEHAPVSVSVLADHLGVDISAVERKLRESMAAHETNGRWYNLRTLADGAVFTHNITSVERGEGVLLAGDDLCLWARLADGDGLRLAEPTSPADAGSRVRTSWDGGPIFDEPVLVGPDGWLDRFGPDNLLVLRLRGDTLEISATTMEEIPTAERAEALSRVIRSCTEAATGALADFAVQAHSDPDVLPAVPLDEVLADILIDDPRVFAEPLLPVGATLAACRMDTRSGRVALAGSPDTADEVADLTPSDILRLGLARTGLRTYTPGSDLTEPLAHLADSEAVLGRIADEVEQDPLDPEMLDALWRTARGTAQRAAALVVTARSAEGRGLSAEAARLIDEALNLAPDLLPALHDGAEYAANRGDIVRADNLLQRAECGPGDGLRAVLHPLVNRSVAPNVGRNEPCPCGSGLKHKKCCLGGAALPLPIRATFLYALLLEYAHRPGQIGHIDRLRDAALPIYDKAARDLALFDCDVAGRFLHARGDWLRADERELIDRWRATPLRVYEVVSVRPGTDVTIRALPDGEPIVVTDVAFSQGLRERLRMLTRLLDDGGGGHAVFDEPLLVNRPGSEKLVAMLADDIDPHTLMESVRELSE